LRHHSTPRAYPDPNLKVSGKVTALAAALLCLVGGRLAAQAAPPDSLPRFRLRLPYDSLVPSPMPSLRPGGRIGARTTPSVVGARWEAAVRAAIVAARAARRQPGLAPPEPAAADSTPAVVEPPPGFPPPGVEPPVADAPRSHNMPTSGSSSVPVSR